MPGASNPHREETLEEANGRFDRTRTPWVIALVVVGVLFLMCLLGGPMANYLLHSRENARRTQCMANLKQIAFQTEDYYSAENAFPSGWKVAENEDPPLPAWGWPAELIPMTKTPYPDAEALQQRLGDLMLGDDPRVDLLQAAKSEFLCPADDIFAFEGLDHPDRRWIHDGDQYPLGLTTYVGNTGHLHDVAGSQPNTGIFFGNSRITIDQITDGQAYTILMGERDLTNCRAGSWPGVPNPMSHDGGPSIWNVVAGARPDINAPPWDGDTKCGEGFSSFHFDGVNVLMVDGSVQFLTNNIDSHWVADPHSPELGVLQRMMIRDDGQSVAP